MLRAASMSVAALLVLAACSDAPSAPSSPPSPPNAPGGPPSPPAPAAAATQPASAPAAAAPAGDGGAHAGHAAPAGGSAAMQAAAKGEKPTGKVSFVEPKDGAKVPPTFTVKFAVEGMKVRPATEDVMDATSGHHHLIVDGDALPLGQVVPADEKHIHYGKGQTEAQVTLAPGTHKLTMQFADGAHASWGPELSSTITVEVQAQ